jgi:uncharacterized protein YqjF (DUF2071 family)
MPESVFLTADWRDLALVNYECGTEVLSQYVPAGTEIDLWEGRCYVSVVGLRFLKTKLLGVPIPFHRDFPEVNLRFYVRREVEGRMRRGVVFIKEVVPRHAVTWVARTFYDENYMTLPMREEITADSYRYEWRSKGTWYRLSVETHGDWNVPDLDSEASFVAEHYWGYAAQRDESTLEYEVEHPRWRMAKADEVEYECDVAGLYGEEFVEALSREPVSAFMAEGSEVVVRRGMRLKR